MASSMDSAYTSDVVVTQLINSMAQLNRACAKKFKKLQKVLRSPPPYATPTPLTAALVAEDSTGAATVHHHLQQHGVRRQEVLSRNPADWTPHSTFG